MTTFGWKGKRRLGGLTNYQFLILTSIVMVTAFQIFFTLFLVIYSSELIWKAALVFSCGISLGGYVLTCKVGWDLEAYEARYKDAVFRKYGVDIDDPKANNLASWYFDHEKKLSKSLRQVDEERLMAYLKDTIENINNYTTIAEREKRALEASEQERAFMNEEDKTETEGSQ